MGIFSNLMAKSANKATSALTTLAAINSQMLFQQHEQGSVRNNNGVIFLSA